MKKVVRILLAILMVACLALSITACKSDCDKGNHTWDEGTVTTAATCTDDGVKTFKCTLCDHGEKTEVIPATGHTPVSADVAPTCTANGKTGATKCSVCGEPIAAGTVVPALDHDYDGQPWLTANGKHYQECKNGCGTKNEHTIGMGAWALKDGKHVQVCTAQGCNVKSEHNPNMGEWTVGQNGKHVRTCKEAGCTVKDEHGAAMGNYAVVNGKHEHACTVTGCTIKANHDANMGEWTVGQDGKHVRTCQETGCALNEQHDANMGAFSLVNGKHEHACTVTGCTVKADHEPTFGNWTVAQDGKHVHSCTVTGCALNEQHDPAMGDYVTTDATNHYKQCTKCSITSNSGAHNQSKLTSLSATQHSVSCSVCGKKYDNAAHSWTLNTEKSTDSTCSKEGKKVYDCACQATKEEAVEKLPHTLEFVITATHHTSKCKVCGHIAIAETAHELEWNNTGTQEHYKWCKTCKYIDEGTRGAHDYENSFVCADCGRTPQDVVVATFYKGTYNRFDTLVAAVASITDSDEAVIYLGKSLEGAGIFIPSERNINFRLQGNTYTVASGAVGSKKYESQAFHIEKNSIITIQNGTITSKSGSGVKMLVQNYAKLNLVNNVILDGTHLDPDGNNPLYTLSNNFGETKINNATIKAKTDDDVAFDVWYGMSSSYADGVKVTLGQNCNITGYIEYGSAVANTDWNKVSLVMLTDRNRSIRFSSALSCEQANIKYENGSSVIAHIKDANWSCEGDKHFHECTRCHAHLDEAACTKVAIGEAKAATCTVNGITAGVKCSVCDHVYEEQARINQLGHKWNDGVITTQPDCTHKGVITFTCTREGCNEIRTEDVDALGHDFATEAWTSVSATQHAHKCSRCDAVSGQANHVYDKNHCEACKKTLTDEELYALIAQFTENSKHKDFMLNSDKEEKAIRTFMLTGTYLSKSGDNCVLQYAEGKTIIAYRMDVSNTFVGDTVKVWGSIRNFNGLIEILLYENTFDVQVPFGQEIVSRGSSSVTATVVDTENNASDKATVALTGLTDGKAENASTVKFSVTLTSGWVVNKITVSNGDEAAWDDVNKQYSVVVKGDTAITVEVKQDDGKQTYELVGTIETKQPAGETTRVDEFSNGVVTIKFTGNTATAQSEHYRMFKNVTAKITITEGHSITKVIFVTTTKGTSDNSGSHIVIGEKNLVYDDTVKSENQYPWISEGGVSEVDIKNDAQVRIVKIYVTYTITVECRHEHTTAVEAKEATCTEQGYEVDGKYCDDCEHFYTDNMTKLADDQIIPATGHNYGEFTHDEGADTHSKTCANANCNDVVTEACVSETYIYDATTHHKTCTVCHADFAKGNHTGDTCACGAKKVIYEVVDATGAAVSNAIDDTLLETIYAMSGDDATVTVMAKEGYSVESVNGNDAFEAQGNNKYKGKLGTDVKVTITVKALAKASFKELVVSGIDKELVSLSIDGKDLAAGASLNGGDKISIYVVYTKADYDLSVVVNQGNDEPVTMTDGNGDATGEYTCSSLGEVTVKVTLTAKATVTVTGNGTVTVNEKASNAQKWSIGSEITIVPTANTGYVLDETPYTVTDGATLKEGDTYIVTGDVKITINATQLVDIIVSHDGSLSSFDINRKVVVGEVDVSKEKTLSFSIRKSDTLIISVVPAAEGMVAYTTINEKKKLFTDNSLTIVVTEDIIIEIATEPAAAKSWKLVQSVNDLKDGMKFVLACNGKKAIAGTYNKSNYLNKVDVTDFTKNTDNLTTPFGANALVFTLEKTGDAWAFKLPDNTYLARNDSGNKVKTVSSSNDTSAQWNITFSSNVLKIQNVGGTSYYLKYNSNSGQERFSCYTSAQNDVQVYIWN